MKFNILSKKLIAIVLAAAVFFTAIAVAVSFSSKATETLNTNIYSISDFTQGEMENNFEQWSGKEGFVGYTGSTATISDGILSLTGGTVGNTRYSAHFHKTESLNQTVSVCFGMDNINPAASAVVWLRAGEYYRTNYKDYVPTGYYLSCTRFNGYSTITLNKAHENDSGIYALTQIGQVVYNLHSYSSSQSAYLDLTVEATATYDEEADTTVINVFVYKGTSLQYSASFEDNESELQDAGKVGFAVNNNQNLTVPFKSFKYHTADNSDFDVFLTENTAKADGTMVGVYTAIDPTATYKFSAYVDASATDTGSFETEPLCIMYKGASNKSQQLLFTPTTEGVKVDTNFKKYTYTVNLPSGYVTESGTFIGTNSSKKGMTMVYVGYAMKDAAINGIKYGKFELRKVNSDGSLGGNLLCNSDFKMGMYGWSDDITSNLWQIAAQDFDSEVSGRYSRAKFNRVGNKYDYWMNFVPTGFTAGEFNLDGKINICDLVYFDELTDYNIYGDIDKNGVIDVNDENAIKDALLNLQHLLNQGEKKVTDIDAITNQKKEDILSASSSLENISSAKVYYVAENGSDSNSGTKNAPWKTIDKVNQVLAAKSASDKYVICFNRGDTFRGKLLLGSNVTLTAYGTGEKPIITVSPENVASAEKWTLVDSANKIYRYNTKVMDVGSIFFNGGESYAAKRTPDIIKDVGGNYSYSYGYEVLEDMQFICLPDAQTAITLSNNTSASITGYVYLKCNSGNPGAIYDSIEFNTREYVVYLNSGSTDITVDNIAVKFGGAHGIGGGDISNLLVQNCEVAYIGGGIQQYTEKDNGDGTYTYLATRYGNAIEVNTACDGYKVDNCYIHDIYDTGVTHQTGNNHTAALVFKDVYYTNNLIENCTYSVEWFAIPGANEDSTMIMDNIVISDNIMRNAGSGFGVTRTLQESMWNMSTHIMGWASHKNQLKDESQFIISNNVFDRSIYSEPTREKRINSTLVMAAAADTAWLPTFSGNTYIHYLDSAFCYYGENVPADVFNASYLSKYALTVNVYDLIGDSAAKVFFVKH